MVASITIAVVVILAYLLATIVRVVFPRLRDVDNTKVLTFLVVLNLLVWVLLSAISIATVLPLIAGMAVFLLSAVMLPE